MFTNLTVQDGLSQDAVNCILQDRVGFMWFGTDGGLNRYNGRYFTVFHHDPSSIESLSGDRILCLYEDDFGMIWVGTHNNGLNRFDPKRNLFVRFLNDPENPDSLGHNHIWALEGDRDGFLWVGTDKGLNRVKIEESMVPATTVFKHFNHNPAEPGSMSPGAINAILEDSRGMLWVGTFGGGLSRYSSESGTFKQYRHDPFNENSLSNDWVKALVEDNEGFIWVGTREGGLNRLLPETERFQSFKFDKENENSISGDYILSLGLDGSGNLWVGTYSEGLNRFDRRTNRFSHYQHNRADPGSIGSNRVSNIYRDLSGVLWFATGSGVGKVSMEAKKFTRHKLSNDEKVGGIKCFYVDQEGIIWLGTGQGGLVRYDRKKNEYQHFLESGNRDEGKVNLGTWAILEDPWGYLWIGTSRGLVRFDKSNQRVERYHMPGVKKGNISTLLLGSNGGFWVGTWSGGIFRGEITARGASSFSRFPPGQNAEGKNPLNYLTSMIEDRNGHLWIGSSGEGLMRLDRDQISENNPTITSFTSQPDQKGHLSSSDVQAIFQDGDGILWIGTSGGGLNRYQEETGVFSHYKEENGLPSNIINGIAEDNMGRLWLSTSRGLSRFDPQREVFRNYDIYDGLQSNQLIKTLCRVDGEMFVGSVHDGLNSFFPEEIKDNSHTPAVLITGFKKLNKEVPMEKNIWDMDRLRLSYKDTVISFEFSSLDYRVPEKNLFKYKLESLNRDWIDLQTRSSATFTNLNPGTYVLRVKGSNNDGVWSPKEARLVLIIDPPFWQTWWAYLVYILALVGVVWVYVRQQTLKLKKERFFAEQLKHSNEQLKLADRIKDEFLANTSHEFRTPLTGMIGIAESMMDGAAGELSEEQLHNLSMIVTSGMRLSSLVNDILDLAKIRRLKIELKKKAVDVYSLVAVVLSLNQPSARKKSIALINNIDPDAPPVEAEESRLEQIFHNLVGNAIKFTERGTITMTAEVQDEYLAIQVSDSGIGIPEDRLNRIFESFEQGSGAVDRLYGGTGLGLAITRSLVELHGGTISVSSRVGLGSTFCITLPLAKKPAGEKEPVNLTLQRNRAALIRLSEGVIPAVAKHQPTNPEFHILIVDDEIVNLQVFTNFLSLQNYAAYQAENGPEALELINKGRQKFDLVLMDVMMPKMSGYEVCQKIREVYPPHELPIIMLTAKGQTEDMVAGFASGANDYVLKPVSKNELLMRIRTHLQLLKTSRNLQISKQKLEQYNRTLEQNVEERTQEIKERNKELETLDNIVRTINREVALDRVLDSLLKQALILFPQAEKGTFLILDRQTERFNFAAVSGYELGSCQGISFSLEGAATSFKTDIETLKGGVHIVNHLENDSRSFLSVLPKPNFSLVMALRLKDVIEGFLVLDNFGESEAFDASDLLKLNRLNSHTVSVVAKARILEEVQRKNQELIRVQQHLIMQEKMAYLGHLTAGIAHEIQNPLNFVNNFAAVAVDLTRELDETFQSEKEKLSPTAFNEVHQNLNDLKENTRLIFLHGQRADQIVRGMMEHSLPGFRGRQSVDINRMIVDQYDLGYHGMCARGMQLNIRLQKDFDYSFGFVEAVPQDIGRAIQNIVHNSFYALSEKKKAQGDGFDPAIRIKTLNKGGDVEIRIWDNGFGITKSDREKIFTPFFTTKPAGEGIGLGLSICYDIIIGHQGKIHVESEEGHFSEFIIALPRR